jgi:hypothetical protein
MAVRVKESAMREIAIGRPGRRNNTETDARSAEMSYVWRRT